MAHTCRVDSFIIVIVIVIAVAVAVVAIDAIVAAAAAVTYRIDSMITIVTMST